MRSRSELARALSIRFYHITGKQIAVIYTRETCRRLAVVYLGVVTEVDMLFPSDQTRRKSWIHAIKRGETRFQSWEPSAYAVVCRSHFKESDYLAETVHGKILSFSTNISSNNNRKVYFT